MREKFFALYSKSIAVIIFLVAWGILSASGAVSPIILPPLEAVGKSFIKLIGNGVLIEDIGISLLRTGLGFLLAVVISVPLGIITGWSERFEKYLDPLLQIFRNTSVLAMFPIFITIFGLGEESKIAIVFWGSLWPCLLNTIDGVKGVDPSLVLIARSMGAPTFSVLRKIVIPASMPGILTGVRLSAGVAVIILVAAEMLGASKGLGFLIFNSQQKFQTANMYVGIITIAILGVLINFLLVRMERRVIGWHREQTAKSK
jgi:NitT/TauT family transport system permease protein